MINKFIGDGIFAFWNPVIYPQTDHARRACETALDLQRVFESLREATELDDVFRELFVRVGVATGPAVVGPCGSEQKYDYTCIGDTVNVAARLESANKFYGTSVLVSDRTRRQAGEDFVFRPLGGVHVKGRHRAVPIHELIGRRGAVDAVDISYAERFGEGVAAFQSRSFEAAEAVFTRCLAERSFDEAARRYRDAAVELRVTPPPEEWVAALTLAEK
jgi:adenylate cyclase